mgnify:CR=1 FL=1
MEERFAICEAREKPDSKVRFFSVIWLSFRLHLDERRILTRSRVRSLFTSLTSFFKQLEWCLKMPPGWLAVTYEARKVKEQSFQEFFKDNQLPEPENPTEHPPRNYRYYLDGENLMEMQSNPDGLRERAKAEMKACPPGVSLVRWLLTEHQHKACANCGKTERGVS